MMNVVIAGAGQNGAQVYHILRRSSEVRLVGFLDDNPARVGGHHCGVPILGTVSELDRLAREHAIQGGIAAVGDNRARARLTNRLRAAGLEIVQAIHPAALIDDTARLGRGVVVEMGAAIHPEAVLEEGVFLGGHAVVSHHSTVGRFALIGGGVVFGGAVHIGPFALIGVGTVLQPGVRVGAHAVTGIATAVVKDVPDHTVVLGVPARVLRTIPPPDDDSL